MVTLLERGKTPPTPARTTSTVDVAIIGMGPWGLAALERLVSDAIELGTAGPDLTVHVVEPAEPGSGLYGGDQPDYLILNTPCGQHSMYPFPERARGRLGMGFYDWAVASGYRWVGDHCEVSPEGRPITRDDFLPRRLMGEYLAWFYRVLVAEMPDSVRIVHHKTSATDIVGRDDHEFVLLDDGTVLRVDHAILTTGQTQNGSQGSGPVLAPYPVERFDAAIAPGASVVVRGMGLVAIDVIIALTLGRGGRFVRDAEGHLLYEPSGTEPDIAMYSRSGHAYCAKSMGSADIFEHYGPRICTPDAIAELCFDEDGQRRRVDARSELLPMLLAEMTTTFYAESARLADGEEGAAETADLLADAYFEGDFEAEVERCAKRFGRFDAGSHLFVGEGETFVDSAGAQAQVMQVIADDVAEALVPGGASPVKRAYEVLRALRDVVRSVVEFGGLSLESHRDFQEHIRNRITRIVAGPPVERCEQLLALLEAGVVRVPFGPAPIVMIEPGGVTVRSRALARPSTEHFDHLILAHLDQPTVHTSASPMLSALYRKGRVRQFRIDGEDLGSIDLTADFHPIGADGSVERRLWVFGALSEGPRYFTAYIPSPASRVRAFVDAGICSEQILEAGR